MTNPYITSIWLIALAGILVGALWAWDRDREMQSDMNDFSVICLDGIEYWYRHLKTTAIHE